MVTSVRELGNNENHDLNGINQSWVEDRCSRELHWLEFFFSYFRVDAEC